MGKKEFFIGFGPKDLKREVGIFRKLKEYYIDEIVMYLNYPHFIAWYHRVLPYTEVKIVQCEICKTDIENDIRNYYSEKGFNGYVCSSKC